jgi:hypothetical protein
MLARQLSRPMDPHVAALRTPELHKSRVRVTRLLCTGATVALAEPAAPRAHKYASGAYAGAPNRPFRHETLWLQLDISANAEASA